MRDETRPTWATDSVASPTAAAGEQLATDSTGPDELAEMRQPPARLVTIIALSVFISEALVMLLLAFLPPFSTLFEALLDSTLLVALLSPTLYYFGFRPLVQRITEHKQAEEGQRKALTNALQATHALRANEERFRTVANFTYDWEYWVDPAGNHIYVSPSCERITGYRADEFAQNPNLLKSIVHPDDQSKIIVHNHAATETGEILPIDFRIVTRSGEERWIGHICQPVHSEDGRYLGQRGSNRNITEHKRVEEALRQRNRELALLNRAGQELVSTLDLDQVLVNILEEVRGLLDVTASSIWLVEPPFPSQGESQGKGLVCWQAAGPKNELVRGWQLAPGQGFAGHVAHSGQSLIVPDAQADERYFKGMDQQTGLKLRSILTIPLLVKDGVIGVLQMADTKADRFSATDLALLEPLGASAAIAIENAQLYEQMRQDAETKSVLLREVNHRVKNNLTGIMGLLYTARNRVMVEDQATYRSTMDDLINRVRGLSTAHDLLSASGWAPLRLSDLAARVINVSLEALPHDKHVSVNVLSSSARVTPDQAYNLALVLGELTTNTAKHTLAERDTAQITFQITLNDRDGIVCEFRDDGPGYPKDILRLEHSNVGFDLIQNIVRKGLRGELTLYNDHGAVAVIRFEAQVRD
ncbi:MAG: hypothetical protein B6I35_13715 [Anaerolineaceae bacterium 4572_32.2]|nr:MAG: hypothetical protein B6I35_13715 [Anaerolineaceae bacterium 4572_32.2]